MDNNEVNAAQAKKNFSELLGRVAYGKERIVISKRGRPLAPLVPVTEGRQADHLSKVKGWLDDDDPFFKPSGILPQFAQTMCRGCKRKSPERLFSHSGPVE